MKRQKRGAIEANALKILSGNIPGDACMRAWEAVGFDSRFVALCWQSIEVEKVVRKLRDKHRRVWEKARRLQEFEPFEIEIVCRPARPLIFPPYSFRVDKNERVHLVGRDISPQRQRVEVLVRFERGADRELFLHVARSKNRKLLGNTIASKSGARMKRSSVRAAGARIRKAIRATMHWTCAEHWQPLGDPGLDPKKLILVDKTGTFSVNAPVEFRPE